MVCFRGTTRSGIKDWKVGATFAVEDVKVIVKIAEVEERSGRVPTTLIS